MTITQIVAINGPNDVIMVLGLGTDNHMYRWDFAEVTWLPYSLPA